MVLGIIRENKTQLVATVPLNCKKYIEQFGLEVWFENDCGQKARFSNQEYFEQGATEKKREDILKNADFLLTSVPLDESEENKLKKKSIYISSFRPYIFDTVIDRLKNIEALCFSLDMIPRISRAQSMDYLSSMASIAGFKAVTLATIKLPRYIPMMITAAGSIKPATVLVIGAGVAGLQAIATAKRLGARVEVMDTRAAAKEEAESLGGKFLVVEGATENVGAGGYAVQQTEDFIQKQRQMTIDACGRADIIICTALVRGKKAPVIITEEGVKNMKRGSVIVDLASISGGNCALTEGEKWVEKHGVQIYGTDIMHESMSQDASTFLSNNCLHFLELFFGEHKNFNVNMEDELISSTLINR